MMLLPVSTTLLLCLVVPGWAVFFLDDHYKQYPGHTMTLYKGFGQRCNLKPGERKVVRSGPFTEREKTAILQYHNNYRRRVAKGEETRGHPGPQPQAADMREMTWDEELAAIAQRWAQQCPDGGTPHDDVRRTDRWRWVGQNMFADKDWSRPFFTDNAPTPAPPSNVTKPVIFWYFEHGNFSKDSVKPFRYKSGCGHYTQVVWGNTYKIGCSLVMIQEKKVRSFYHMYAWNRYIICNYGPGGNVPGLAMYTIGRAGSKCPSGTKNNDGLCSIIARDASSVLPTTENTLRSVISENPSAITPTATDKSTELGSNASSARAVSAVTTSESCKTISGKTCVFPFFYRGSTYTGCTKRNYDKYWCATLVGYNRSFIRGQWDACTAGCPEHSGEQSKQKKSTAIKIKKFLNLINSLNAENKQTLINILKLFLILIIS